METCDGVVKESLLQETVCTGSVEEPNEIKLDETTNQSAKTLQVETELMGSTAPFTDPDQLRSTNPPPTKPAETKVRLVICPEDGILLSQFPWKPKLKVCLKRATQIEVNI